MINPMSAEPPEVISLTAFYFGTGEGSMVTKRNTIFNCVVNNLMGGNDL